MRPRRERSIMTEHTKTPWQVYDEDCEDGAVIIHSPSQEVNIAVMSREPEMRSEITANAAHIVKCVNLHDELVEALEVVAQELDRWAREEYAAKILAKVKGT